jgi:hypothetical protein
VRARVYQRGDKWVAVWQATRHFDERWQAEQAAALPVPPPARHRSDLVSDELRRFICQLHEGGMTPHLIAALLAQANIPTARGGTWHPATVRRIVEAEQRAEGAREDDGAAHKNMRCV